MPILLFFILLILLVVFGHQREMLNSHRKYANGVRNHDPQLREFVYRTERSADEIQDRLRREFRVPALKYRFDADDGQITFESDIPNGSPTVRYTVHVTGQGSGALIRVIQADHLPDNKYYALHQNEFWSQLADAEPVPYFERRNQP